MKDTDKLRTLADWLDLKDRQAIAEGMGVSVSEVPDYMVNAGNEVQRDLLLIAARLDLLTAENADLRELLEQRDLCDYEQARYPWSAPDGTKACCGAHWAKNVAWKRIQELEAALAPFANVAATWTSRVSDDEQMATVWLWDEGELAVFGPPEFTLGDARRAAALLKEGSRDGN